MNVLQRVCYMPFPLWEFAEANDIVVHIHPPMLSVWHETFIQYRLNEAVGRPFDSTNGARMGLETEGGQQ